MIRPGAHAGPLAATLALAAVAALATVPAHAQILRNFTPRFSTNDNGDVALIGNTLMSCSGGGGCGNARNGTGGNLNNNDFTMRNVDVDTDAGTFNSSRATLALPPGATVLWAGLYWMGNSNGAGRNQLRFSTPVAGYVTLTATQLDANGAIYQGYVDVTARVQAGGNGSYTIANVASTIGANSFAGWGLVVVYRNTADPPRNLVVFDGFGEVAPGATQTINVSGFLTPPAGAVTTRLGVIAGEGDLGFTGDAFQLNGVALSDAVNPANNFFNSSVSRLGAHVTTKTPNYQNQLGWDVDLVSANGRLPNGATSATITLNSTDDRYYPGVVTFATDLYQPIITGDTFAKTVTDLNGGAVQPGDVLEYLVTVTNTGNDAAINLVVRDTLPANAVYVPGSIVVVSGPNPGAKSDASGDDQAEFAAALGRVTVRLGTGANAANGGRLAPAASTSVRFRATVAVPSPTGTVVSNQAAANFNGEQLGTAFATLSDGDAAAPGVQRTNLTVTAPVLSGTVFEDPNYGGGAGRSLAASGGSPRPGARVELYGASGAYLAADTTDAAGLWSFDGRSPGSYTVRVVNRTVSSSRSGWSSGLVPVQTFRTNAASGAAVADPDRVGGEDPAKQDANSNLSSATLAALTTAANTAQSVAPVTLGTASLGGVDFGFNFDLIVHRGDGGQGSLRQFLANAGALGNAGLAQQGKPAGIECSIFMIPDGAPHPGLRAGLASGLLGGVARIAVTSSQLTVSGAATWVDGTTQTANVSDSNPALLGAGGTAGVDGLAVATVPAPEVEIVDGAAITIGLDVQAADVTVRGVAITNFGSTPGSDLHANLRLSAAAANARIERCVLGSSATAFADPGAARSGGDNLRASGADDGVLRDCLIGFAAGSGVSLVSNADRWQVTGSEIRGNAIGNGTADGVTIAGGGNATLRGNAIAAHEGAGVDARASGGGNTIENNRIERNGIGTAANAETPGVRLGGSGNRVDRNQLLDNFGAGVLVPPSSSGNLITRNSIATNGTILDRGGAGPSGEIGVDLLRAGEDEARGTAPFVTLNDVADADAGGNGLLNFPVLESATLGATTLVLTGWARPGSAIELFLADADPSGFGEGLTYLATVTEGSAADLDATSSAYAGPINGLAQGSDNTNRFRFAIAIPPGVAGGARLTATATLGGSTSEFSGLAIVGGGVALSGVAFADLDHDAARDGAEGGTGVALWAKLVSLATPGVAQSVAAADPGTGAWAFPSVGAGTYRVVLDDNALASDVTATSPAGWIGTLNPTGAIAPVVVSATPIAGLDFGLWHGSRLDGRVFRDDGAGGGAANDGIAQGGEAAIAGARVRLLAAACAGGACDSAASDAGGAWTLWLPFAAAGSGVAIEETNPSAWLSTGGGAGTTGGSYDRASDRVTFVAASGVAYSGLAFGDVPPNGWAPSAAQTVFPGNAALYPHTFAAGSAGTLTLGVTRTTVPALGWGVTLIRDLDCDGAVDPGEPAITGPLALGAGQSVCVLVRHDAPAGAPDGASELLAIAAAFDYAGASPPLAASQALDDRTTVASAGALVLTKSADLATARPGEWITYTITYTNSGPAALSAIELHDATPAFTTFDAAGCGTLGAGLAACAVTLAPAPGATGPVRWTLTGALAPGGSGTVTLRVRVE